MQEDKLQVKHQFQHVDGVDWTTRDLTFNIKWSSASYGKSANTTSEWLLLARGGNDVTSLEQVKKQSRSQIASGTIQYMKILDPGSGYTAHSTIQLIDNKATTDAPN